MKKALLLLATALLLAASPVSAQTKWNLPCAYPADNPHTVNLMQFAKDVSDATGGKLQVTVHPAASLFKAPDIKRAVQTGQAQIGEVLSVGDAPASAVVRDPDGHKLQLEE